MTNNVYADQADALEQARPPIDVTAEPVDQAIVDGIVKLLRQAEAARALANDCERKAQRLIETTPCWDGAFVTSDYNDVLVTSEGRAELYRVKR